MSKRKKTSAAPPHGEHGEPENESVTTRATVPPEVMKAAMGGGDEIRGPLQTDVGSEHDLDTGAVSVEVPVEEEFDAEMTVNLVGDLMLPGRDDLDEPTVTAAADGLEDIDRVLLQRKHLRGLLEALVFASDSPIKAPELAKLASAPLKQVKELLGELKIDFANRGVHLDEVAGGWVFRTSPQYAPFVRDLTKQKPVRLTRAQVETLAIVGYRQPITRPEVDDVRGVDSGPVLKLLLERDLIRILGTRDEPGRPLIYGTTTHFLEFFGLKSLKDLPTLREFTELSDESRSTFEDELGETPEDAARRAAEAAAREVASDLGETTDPGIEHEGRSVHESMSVPVAEPALDDLGEDDLEPIENASSESPHASDDDGPTLTSEAPNSEDED